jgi:hypothetical protein
MRAEKIVLFLIVLLLFSGLMQSAHAASEKTASFHGSQVTIDLTYPDEAHPTDSIRHNVTITANTALTLSVMVDIEAFINSSWQKKAEGGQTNQDLSQSEILTIPMRFTPQNADGFLRCSIYLQTDQTVDDISYTFYTTLVSDPTFSEIENEYDTLGEEYTSLYNTYTSLLNQYNRLSDDYEALNAIYKSKIDELNDFQTNYDDLNATRYILQASYNTLQTTYEDLNQTYTDLQIKLADLQEKNEVSEDVLSSDRIVMFIFIVIVAVLIAFIIYLKKKKEEPYLVIRKETVNIDRVKRFDSNSKPSRGLKIQAA